MAFATSTIIAIGALILSGATYYSSEQSRKEAKANYRNQADEQRKSASEQKALNAQRAADERRQQVREQRIKLAKIEQASENTGTEGSSGLLGATGGLATQLGASIGSNLGALAASGRIAGYNQVAANFGTAAQNNLSDMGASQNLFGLSTSIFNANGGFSAFKSAAPATGTT